MMGDRVFVADSTNNAIVEASFDALLSASKPQTGAPVFATINAPGLLTVDEDGVLYTTCDQSDVGGICQVSPINGEVNAVDYEFQDPRDVAVDRTHARLYVVDRAKLDGQTSRVLMFPLQ
jgi:sugar lactone lactonase YvrE